MKIIFSKYLGEKRCLELVTTEKGDSKKVHGCDQISNLLTVLEVGLCSQVSSVLWSLVPRAIQASSSSAWCLVGWECWGNLWLSNCQIYSNCSFPLRHEAVNLIYLRTPNCWVSLYSHIPSSHTLNKMGYDSEICHALQLYLCFSDIQGGSYFDASLSAQIRN